MPTRRLGCVDAIALRHAQIWSRAEPYCLRIKALEAVIDGVLLAMIRMKREAAGKSSIFACADLTR